jgi:hypothetical protein
LTLWIDQTASDHDEQSKQLVKLLTSLMWTREQVVEILEATPCIDLGDVPWPAVEFRARRFWTAYVLDLRGKAVLRHLVDTAARRFPARRGDLVFFLQLRADRTPVSWYVIDDPLKAMFVGPGSSHPMLDRKPLRENLSLLNDHGYRTLNITGGSASGKTFSLQLLQLLAVHRGFSVLHVDVEDWGTERFTALSLIGAIASQLRIAIDTTVVNGVFDPYSRARLLLYELRDAFPGGNNERWVVLDGLDRANVEPDARALVERLLKSIDVDHKPNVRLVVTGFDGILPQDTRRDPIGPIARGDVRELFETTTKHLSLNVTEAEVDKWTDDVLRGYNPARHDLAELGSEVYKTVQEKIAARVGKHEPEREVRKHDDAV